MTSGRKMSTSTDWKNEYMKNFDAEWYLDTYYGSVTGSAEEGNFLEFALDEIHNIFTSGLCYINFDTGYILVYKV